MGLLEKAKAAGQKFSGLVLEILQELRFTITSNPEMDSQGGSFIWKTITGAVSSWRLRDDVKGQDILVVDTLNDKVQLLEPYEAIGFDSPFATEKTSITGSDTGVWVTRSLGVGYENKLVRVTVEASTVGLKISGVRSVGDLNNLSFFHRGGAKDFEAKADSIGDIEILSDSNDLIFWITGTK